MHNVSHRCKNMQTHTSTASAKKRKSHPQPSVLLRAQIGQDFTAKQRSPEPFRARANFSPPRNIYLAERTQCFVQVLAVKSHPRRCSSHAICQEWLAKHNQGRNFSALLVCSLLYFSQLYSTYTRLLFYGSLYLYLYSALLSSTQLYSALLSSTQLYSPLLSPTLLYPTLLYSPLPYSTLLCSTLPSSALLYSTLLSSPLPYPTLLYSTLLYSTLRYATLLHSTLLDSTLLYSTLRYATLLYSTLLYSTRLSFEILSSLPLLYLYAGADWTQWSFGLVRMWLHDLLRHTSTGHNDLWAGENVKIRNSEFSPWNFLWQIYYATLHYTNYTTLRYTTLHCTALHYTTLH